MVSSIRRKSASSSCLAPVPATVSEFSFAALMKSCPVFHGLSSLTQRKKGSRARLATGVKSVALNASFCVMMVVKKLLRVIIT